VSLELPKFMLLGSSGRFRPAMTVGSFGPQPRLSTMMTSSNRQNGGQRYILDTEKEPTMAGAVRQPIDVDALSKYVGRTVTDIKLPIAVKQVWLEASHTNQSDRAYGGLVWLWTVKSNVPNHRQ